MALHLAEKEKLVSEIKDGIARNQIVILAQCERMSVSEITDLRTKLRESSVTLKMYKNTLVKRALNDLDPENAGFKKLFEHLKGPSALVFSEDKPLGACKIISESAKESAEKVSVKAAYFEEHFMSKADVKSLGDIGSKEMLIARLLTALKSPMSRLVNCLKSPQSNLVLVLKSVADKKESVDS